MSAAPLAPGPHRGRTLAAINDLTIQEQLYLYQTARELKEAVAQGGDLNAFRLRNPEAAVYLIFMEDSTRTKESFRNAAEFHGMKVNMFDAKTSSFQKSETITDTIKMLCGYSIGHSTFVIRSKIEGVCRWLEEAMAAYASQIGVARPSFINAGDGRHEHPTQELLDEFTFLEHSKWDRSAIHVALLGDLFHGRTIHSKADGLRAFEKVQVDLIAPDELGMPPLYEERMKVAGFTIRKFESIEEYLAQGHVATIWYFTRLQLERMGDKVLERQGQLRQAVTMRREFLDRLPSGTRFFHPLPRDSRFPVLPFWLDDMKLNGWDQQSQNGYFTRIVLLGMLSGHFRGPLLETPRPASLADADSPESPALSLQPLSRQDSPALMQATDFIERQQISADSEAGQKGGRDVEAGLVSISAGVVIDHIAQGQPPAAIWRLMYKIRAILCIGAHGGQGVFRAPPGEQTSCGLISVPDLDISEWDRGMLKRLAAVAPGSTLNVVREGRVQEKFFLRVPPRIYNFPDISCRNTACVSNPESAQHEVQPYFLRAEARDGVGSGPTRWAFTCKYCEKLHNFQEIWN